MAIAIRCSERALKIRWGSVLAVLGLLITGNPQPADADHINFRERDMRALSVGETRENPVFYGCQDKQATIELSTWIDSAPWTIDKLMQDEAGRAKFGGDVKCNEYRPESIEVVELLYLADQERGEDKVDRNGNVHFGTRYSSILKVVSNTGVIYYMLAHQLIKGTPTEQERICVQVLWSMCP